jgi:hypothetical protein
VQYTFPESSKEPVTYNALPIRVQGSMAEIYTGIAVSFTAVINPMVSLSETTLVHSCFTFIETLDRKEASVAMHYMLIPHEQRSSSRNTVEEGEHGDYSSLHQSPRPRSSLLQQSRMSTAYHYSRQAIMTPLRRALYNSIFRTCWLACFEQHPPTNNNSQRFPSSSSLHYGLSSSRRPQRYSSVFQALQHISRIFLA